MIKMSNWETSLIATKTKFKKLIVGNKDDDKRVFPEYLSFQTKKLSRG